MSNSSVKITKLENGLTIATDTMNNVESVSIGIWANAGARNENEKNNGVAHYLEHMVFKGTTNRTARQIAEEIENPFGLDANDLPLDELCKNIKRTTTEIFS